MRKEKDVKQSILDNIKINEITDCWEWQKGTDGRGYGSFKVFGKNKKVHRASYEIFNGEIPNGLFILHSCDNPICCNPEHLTTGTNADNLRDMTRKGRNRPQRGENNGRSKLNVQQVLIIKHMKGVYREIAKLFNVGTTVVADIKRGKTWRSITMEGELN